MEFIISYLLNTGIGIDTPNQEIKKIRILNIILLVGIIVSFLWLVVFKVANNLIGQQVSAVGLVLFAILYILNYYSLYKLAQIVTVLCFPLYYTWYALYFGSQSGIEYMLISAAIIPSIFFDKRKQILPLLFLNLSLFVFMKAWFFYNPSNNLDTILSHSFYFANLIMVFFSAFALVAIFKNEYSSYEHIITEKNTLVTDSINYAKRLQEALSPTESEFKLAFPNSFVFLKPRDIVSGDFFWFHQHQNKKVLVVSDCTGHGIPGALMTVLGFSLLNEIVAERKILDPAAILTELDHKIVTNLKQNKNKKSPGDGMDISVLLIEEDLQKATFSSAKSNLLFIGKETVQVYKGNRNSVGGVSLKHGKVFTNKVVHYQSGEKMYLFSDGFPDQFGGPKGRKYLIRRFREFLIANHVLTMDEQRNTIENELSEWRGKTFFNTREDRLEMRKELLEHVKKASHLPSREIRKIMQDKLSQRIITYEQTDDILVVGISF